MFSRHKAAWLFCVVYPARYQRKYHKNHGALFSFKFAFIQIFDDEVLYYF